MGAAKSWLTGFPYSWICLCKKVQWVKGWSVVEVLVLISCKVARHSQHIPSLPCQPGKEKISLNAFQSALAKESAALMPWCSPAFFLLGASDGFHGLPSCLAKGRTPVAKLCKTPIQNFKNLIESARCNSFVLKSSQREFLKFTHSGTPGRDKFMTSKLWDLSQLNGTPSHQRAKGIRCAASNSLLALRHSF